MILSIDLNPILKRNYFMDSLELNLVNIPKKIICAPSGAGIELANLLSRLNQEVMVSGFLGGVNGAFIHKYLLESSIPHDYLSIKDETTDNLIIWIKEGEDFLIRTREPRITREELGSFLELFNKLLNKSEIICFVGEISTNIPNEIFYDLICSSNKHNKRVLLSIKGEKLYYALKASPYLVVLSKEDLEHLTNLKLDYEYEIIKAGLFILEKGVSIVFIPLGSKGSIVLTHDNVYRIDVSNNKAEICNVNYEYIIGGLAIAIEKNYDFDMMLKIGQACGIVNCFSYRENIDMSDIKRIMGEIEINKFNY